VDSEAPQTSQSKPGDNLIFGCGLGCLTQLIFIVLGVLIASQGNGSSKMAMTIACSWGVTQWIALIPLILVQRANGRPRTVQGLVITGCIGVLLSSACYGMISS
jgi:hypothetical protein